MKQKLSHRCYEIKKQSVIIDGVKQHFYLCPALMITGSTIKDIREQIDKKLKWVFAY